MRPTGRELGASLWMVLQLAICSTGIYGLNPYTGVVDGKQHHGATEYGENPFIRPGEPHALNGLDEPPNLWQFPVFRLGRDSAMTPQQPKHEKHRASAPATHFTDAGRSTTTSNAFYEFPRQYTDKGVTDYQAQQLLNSLDKTIEYTKNIQNRMDNDSRYQLFLNAAQLLSEVSIISVALISQRDNSMFDARVDNYLHKMEDKSYQLKTMLIELASLYSSHIPVSTPPESVAPTQYQQYPQQYQRVYGQ